MRKMLLCGATVALLSGCASANIRHVQNLSAAHDTCLSNVSSKPEYDLLHNVHLDKTATPEQARLLPLWNAEADQCAQPGLAGAPDELRPALVDALNYRTRNVRALAAGAITWGEWKLRMDRTTIAIRQAVNQYAMEQRRQAADADAPLGNLSAALGASTGIWADAARAQRGYGYSDYSAPIFPSSPPPSVFRQVEPALPGLPKLQCQTHWGTLTCN